MLRTAEHFAGEIAPHGAVLEPIRVLVVSDTRLYREGLAEVFGRTESLHVVATVAHALDAVAILDAEAIGVVLLGLGGRDTLAAARLIAGAHAGASIVALAVDDRPEDVVPLAEAGVCGYLAR